MDIRSLQYFLAVAQEGSITKAAQVLHMTQPPLSRQLKDLEDELGKQLFIRGKRTITLTEEGAILRRRAEEIVHLMEKAQQEVSTLSEEISGEVAIGGGETEGMRLIAKSIAHVQHTYPKIRFTIHSGHAEDVKERLDEGVLDFGIFIEPTDLTKYDFVKLFHKDVWGLLMRKDHPFAEKDAIEPNDLRSIPLIVSNQGMVKNEMSGWLSGEYRDLDIRASYNLLFNASLMVEEGVGSALCIDGIVKTTEDSELCFRPLRPPLEVGAYIAWRKNQLFTKAAHTFLEHFNNQ